jgi:N-acetylglutamate synthase-like GNAT family acetyltransferase
VITGEDIIAALEHATDLDGVELALKREQAIRSAVAESGQSRQLVEMVLEDLKALGFSAALILTEHVQTIERRS